MKDTIAEQKNTIDSLIIYKDSITVLNEQLFVYKYKLERIREYSNIVAKDNSQLVFLRGWINRTLNN